MWCDPQLTGVPAAGARGGVAMGGEHGSLTPDGTCTSNIEGGLVFGGRSGPLENLRAGIVVEITNTNQQIGFWMEEQ